MAKNFSHFVGTKKNDFCDGGGGGGGGEGILIKDDNMSIIHIVRIFFRFFIIAYLSFNQMCLWPNILFDQNKYVDRHKKKKEGKKS